MYAKILEKNGLYDASILVLKALAKIFPNLTNVDTPYTLKLQNSLTYNDLDLATDLPRNSIEAYSVSNSRNSFSSISNPEYLETLKLQGNRFSRQNHDILTKFIDEDAAPKPEENENPRKSESLCGDILKGYRSFKKFNNLAIEIQDTNEDIKSHPILSSHVIDLDKPVEFIVSSNPIFLYKIAKISSKYVINLTDGLFAIDDFLSLLKFERSSALREKLAYKSLYIKAILMTKLDYTERAKELINEISPILVSKGYPEKSKILEDLKII